MGKQPAIVNVMILGVIPFIGLLISIILFGPVEYWRAFLLLSLALISIGKYSQFQKGKWLSFGSKNMEKPYKYFYLAGWFFLLISLLITIAIKLNA